MSTKKKLPKPRAKVVKEVAGYTYRRKIRGRWRTIKVEPRKVYQARKAPKRVVKARVKKVAEALKVRRKRHTPRPLKERRKRQAPREKTPRRAAPKPVESLPFDFASSWRDRIASDLTSTRDQSGYQGKVLVARNADGTVDGELRLVVPPKTPARKVLMKLAEIAVISAGTWFSLGARYSDSAFNDADRDRYLLFKGLRDVATHYGPAKLRGDYFASTLMLLDDMVKTAKRKPLELVLRVHWNGTQERPERM